LWAEASLVAHRGNELRDEEFASGSQATRANNGVGWIGILSDLNDRGKREPRNPELSFLFSLRRRNF